jgi:hypothetical protein
MKEYFEIYEIAHISHDSTSLFILMFKGFLHYVLRGTVSTMENSLYYKIWFKFSIMCVYFLTKYVSNV